MIEPSTRLRRAIRMKDAVLVKRIITASPQCLVNPDYQDKSNTSLHLATELGYEEVVVLLLAAGHDATEISRNTDWETPLMLAADRGHIGVGRILVERCSSSIRMTNRRGLDALSLAASRPSSTQLLPQLLFHPSLPASLSHRDHQGNTPLHHASANGSLKALRLLLEAGADPEARNLQDWTPLAYSATVQAEVYFKQLIAEFDAQKTTAVQHIQQQQQQQSPQSARSAISPMGYSALPLPPTAFPTLERLATAPGPVTSTAKDAIPAPLIRSTTSINTSAAQADAAAMPPPFRPFVGRERSASATTALQPQQSPQQQQQMQRAQREQTLPRMDGEVPRRKPGVRLVRADDDGAAPSSRPGAEPWSPSVRRAVGAGDGATTPTGTGRNRMAGYFDGTRLRAHSGD